MQELPHRVGELAVGEAQAPPRVVDDVGCVAHRLAPSRQHDLGIAGNDLLGREHRGLHAGSALALDRGRRDFHRYARLQRGGAGRVGLGTRLHAVPENDVIEHVAGHAGPLHRLDHDDRGELVRPHVFQRLAEARNGGPAP